MSNTDSETVAKVDERNLDDLTPAELLALSRAAEAKANVFRSLANRNERYRKRLEDVTAEAAQYHEKLKEQNIDPATGGVADPSKVVPDKEGTAPSLADAHGNYAEDAETANLGGIGIDDSNTNPDEVRQELADRSDPEVQAQRQRDAEEAARPARRSSERVRVRPTSAERSDRSANNKDANASTKAPGTGQTKVKAGDPVTA